jgi:MerR family transcriptional regulator, thiopeptide resistance regulator
MMKRTVSQVAQLTGVTVRTLHHYDEIGLLRPSARSEAGYRLYDDADLERLQQVLFFRVLEFPLEEIARIMHDPHFDVRAALQMQRQLLEKRAGEVRRLIDAVDAAINRLEKGTVMRDEDVAELFGGFDPKDYEEEVKERWGDTEAYRESRRRTSAYTGQDWEKITKESGELFLQFAGLMTGGTPPTDVAAMNLAEQHRQHIERWFYPCPRAMHRALGENYVADSRFSANIDKNGPGLSAYLRDAFRANADRE